MRYKIVHFNNQYIEMELFFLFENHILYIAMQKVKHNSIACAEYNRIVFLFITVVKYHLASVDFLLIWVLIITIRLLNTK